MHTRHHGGKKSVPAEGVQRGAYVLDTVLILAGVAGTELEAEATVTVTPAVPTLPVTGMKLTAAIAAGLLFVGGGALLLVTIRKRRIQFTA